MCGVAIYLPSISLYAAIWNEKDFRPWLKPGSTAFFAVFLAIGALYTTMYFFTETMTYKRPQELDDEADDPNQPGNQFDLVAIYYVRFIVCDVLLLGAFVYCANRDTSPHLKRVWFCAMSNLFLTRALGCIPALYDYSIVPLRFTSRAS